VAVVRTVAVVVMIIILLKGCAARYLGYVYTGAKLTLLSIFVTGFVTIPTGQLSKSIFVADF
jgi:hypothetical protein